MNANFFQLNLFTFHSEYLYRIKMMQIRVDNKDAAAVEVKRAHNMCTARKAIK